MHWTGLDEPNVTIDARAFIKPAFDLRRVHAHDHHIPPTIVDVIGDVQSKAAIAALVLTNQTAVEPHMAIAEDAVKFNRQAATLIALGNIECAAIPADT